jgi:hypothetical protein
MDLFESHLILSINGKTENGKCRNENAKIDRRKTAATSDFADIFANYTAIRPSHYDFILRQQRKLHAATAPRVRTTYFSGHSPSPKSLSVLINIRREEKDRQRERNSRQCSVSRQTAGLGKGILDSGD